MMHEHDFFPWGGLPYPYKHAQLALDLVRKGEGEAAWKMVAFQQATLDHRLKPVLSFFRQERGISYAQLEELNRQFFEALEKEPESTFQFVDKELGILSRRSGDETVICFGSGCKSGMGLYLSGNGGVVNFGLQLGPLGECSGFGLAGKGRHIEASENSLRYQCRLAAPHPRNTGIPGLEDSGYCGMWVETLCQLEGSRLKIASELEGYRPISDFLLTFFIKAEACFVAGSHKLNPRSLDRYQGPPQKVQFHDLTFFPEGGFRSMEVIPLAGDDSYWGADFMITLSLLNKTFQFNINRA